jgi:hypothetical protein
MSARLPGSPKQNVLDRTLRWIALDFDGHTWPVIAVWLFSAQVVVFAISRVVDAVWFPETSSAMLLFVGYVALDALQVGFGLKKSVLWASLVTLFRVFGAVPYVGWRQHVLCAA